MNRIAVVEAGVAGLLVGSMGALEPALLRACFLGGTWSDAAASWSAVSIVCVGCAAVTWLVARIVLEGDDALPFGTAAKLGAACTLVACFVGLLADHFTGSASETLFGEDRSLWMRTSLGLALAVLSGGMAGILIGWVGRKSMRRHRNT